MKNLLIFCFVLLTCSACQRVLLKAYGIEQPQLESYHSLKSFLDDYAIESEEIYVFKDTTTFNQFLKKGVSLPDANFFNKNKYFVDYKTKNSSCNGEVGGFIEQLGNIDLLPNDSQIRLDGLVDGLVNAETNKDFSYEKKAPADAYIVIYWAKYLGKLNKTKILDWETKLRSINPSETKVRLIKVNVDFQDFWGIDEKDIPVFDY